MSSPSSNPVRILIVDDSAIVRSGIKELLAAEKSPPMTVVAEAGTAAEAVELCRRHRPDIVLLDIRLPDGSGLEACRKMLEHAPDTRVVVLTSHSNDRLIYDAVSSGAQGYLMKEVDPDGFINALRNVAAGRSILDPEVTTRILRMMRGGPAGAEPESALAALAPQEMRVVQLVAAGRTNKEIADQLKLSENTVKHYIANAFDKLGVKRRSQAAALYVQQAKPEVDGP
jgi:DNA-binding NarL/FixJ family response regulator